MGGGFKRYGEWWFYWQSIEMMWWKVKCGGFRLKINYWELDWGGEGIYVKISMKNLHYIQ